jgi:hypothetical protein
MSELAAGLFRDFLFARQLSLFQNLSGFGRSLEITLECVVAWRRLCSDHFGSFVAFASKIHAACVLALVVKAAPGDL